MPKLRVCKLVQTPRGCHTEIPPHVFTAPEVQFLHSAGTGLEVLVRVLCCNTTSNHMTMRGGARIGATWKIQRVNHQFYNNKEQQLWET